MSVFSCCLQALLQDVQSHARMLDRAVEKAQSLQQSGVGDQAVVSAFIAESKDRYQILITRAKVWNFFKIK